MKKRHAVLILLFFLSIITYVDRVCISVAGPRMQQELNLGPELWGWVVGLFTLSYAAFEIPAGALADRMGPRRVASRIVLWWSFFTSLTGAVQNFWQLAVCRFLFGAGEAGAYPNCTAAISRWFPFQERAKATGIVWMASRLGGALSPFLVVPIAITWGWRTAFWVFGLVGAVWVIIWFAWFRDNPKDQPGITQQELDEIGPSASHSHTALPWTAALRNANFWTLLLMYHTYCWGSYFYLSWLHTYLQRGRGYTELEIRDLSWLPFILGACGNLFGGWLSDRLIPRIGLIWGRRSIGAAGLAASGLLMLATPLVPGKIAPLVLLSLGYFSMDCMLPVAWAVCLDVGKSYAGSLSGAMNMAGQLGSFLSSLAFGYIVKYALSSGYPSSDAYNLPLYPFSAFLLVSALLFLRVDPTRSLEARQPPHWPATPHAAPAQAG